MKISLLLLVVIVTVPFLSKSQDLVFADPFSGGDTQVATSVSTDHSGNIFVSSVFYDEMDADPGPGVTQLNAIGSGDVALIKLSPAGDFVWVIQLGGPTFETATKVLADQEGNVLITGYFQNTIDFDPGLPVYNLTAGGVQDGYLAKYDQDGNLLWAYSIGSAGYEDFYGFDTDSAGNIYSTGYFQNTIDFNPGVGVTNLTAIGNNAVFFWKLDKYGNFIWAKQIAGVYVSDLQVDDDANMLVTGNFFGTIDFNPGAGTFNLSATGFGYDAYVMKLNENGIFQWAESLSGASTETGLCIWHDELSQNILVGGRFEGTVDFDPGSGTENATSTGYHDAFVTCLSNNGSLLWVKTFGGAGYDDVSSIQTDASKNIHLSGVFEQTSDLDPSNIFYPLISNGYTDGYLAVWDSSANFISAFQLGGNLDDWLSKMVIDDEGGILCSGHFSSSVDFDPGADVYTLSTFTGWDGFVAKYCITYTIENFVSICEGESYYAGGEYQTEAGDYYDYFNPSIGCDSIVITHLSFNHPDPDLGNDTAICENEIILLDAGNPGSVFQWSNGDTTQIIEVSGGIFSVIITDAAGCDGIDTITISENPLPLVDLGNDVTICNGDSVLIDAGNAGADYLWNTGETSQTIYASSSSLYFVTVTDENGCVKKDTLELALHPLPEIYFTTSADTTICLSDALLELAVAMPPGGEYTGDGVSGNVFNPSLAGLGDHVITYTYTDTFGCMADSSFIITVTICTGIQLTSASEILIYPNPSNGNIFIERAEATAAAMTVTNAEGKIMNQFFLPALPRTEISLDNFPPGVYFLYKNGTTTSFIGKIFISDKY